MKKSFPLIVLLLIICIKHNLAQTNTLLGSGAGNVISSGTNNSIVGYYSGFINTSGSHNSFLGAYSGYKNTSGSYNLFLGSKSGYNNTTGTQNIFLGYLNGYSNTTGNYNSFIGTQVGYSNTSGSYNTFSGYKSGYSNSTGSNNIFIGYNSGYSNTTGYYNSFLGTEAGKNNTTGVSNTLVGHKTGANITTGDLNTFVGESAGNSTTTANYNSFFGGSAGENNSAGSKNSFLGYAAGIYNTSGEANVFIGYDAGDAITTGSHNTFIGTSTGASLYSYSNLEYAVAIGCGANVSANNCMALGGSGSAAVNVGIGTSAPAYQLQLSTDNAAKAGSATWTIASDQRLKKDISDFTDGLSVLEKIHPVWFSYNGTAGMPTNKKFVGIVAQEMKEIAPYTVGKFISQDTLGNKTEYLDYDANALFYILVNSVKEQQTSLKQKDSIISTLISSNQILNERLTRLEQLIENNFNSNNSSSIQNISECCEASLEQNYPNPFNQTTSIKYFLNENVKNASIIITTLEGIEVNRYAISTSSNQIIIPANSLSSGTYFYQLIVDSKLMDTKKMEIIK